MLSRRAFRLCLFEPTTVVFRVIGSMPQFSLSPAWATIYLLGEAGHLWRHDADFGVSDTGELEAIDETITFPTIRNEIDVAFEINLPDDVSTQAAELAFTVESPAFEISPVFGGRDLRCIQTAEPPRLSIEAFDIFGVGDQKFAARVIDLLYNDADATKALFVAIGINPADIFTKAPDLTPDGGVIAARQGNTLFIGKIGTTTNGQLATQGLQLMQGPKPIGGVGTIPIWAGAGTAAFHVAANHDLAEISRFILCGHSLGGAALSWLAAILLQHYPSSRVDVLTFGSPKPGDELLLQALAGVPSCRLENDDDAVPYTPPSPGNIHLAVALVIGPQRVANLAAFKHPIGRTVLWSDGTRTEGDPVQPDTGLIDAMVLAWLVGFPGPNTASHKMSEYVRRLDLA